jgi:hypothetical protein
MRAILSSHLMLLDLLFIIICGEEYIYEDSLYVMCSILQSQPVSKIQIFSSAPRAQTPSLNMR